MAVNQAFFLDHGKDIEIPARPAPEPTRYPANTAFRPMPAAPDVPSALGWPVMAVYAWIVGVFWTAFGTNTEAAPMLIVSTGLSAILFATIAIFLRTEPKNGDTARTLRAFHGPDT